MICELSEMFWLKIIKCWFIRSQTRLLNYVTNMVWIKEYEMNFRSYLIHSSCSVFKKLLLMETVQWVPGALSPGVKRGRGVMLTTHSLLVPRYKRAGAIPPLTPSATAACSGRALHFTSGNTHWVVAIDTKPAAKALLLYWSAFIYCTNRSTINYVQFLQWFLN
jgi:hypothetical protein